MGTLYAYCNCNDEYAYDWIDIWVKMQFSDLDVATARELDGLCEKLTEEYPVISGIDFGDLVGVTIGHAQDIERLMASTPYGYMRHLTDNVFGMWLKKVWYDKHSGIETYLELSMADLEMLAGDGEWVMDAPEGELVPLAKWLRDNNYSEEEEE